MNRLLYTLALILIIGWILGFLIFNLGALIHLLLVIAIIVILVRIIKGKKPI